MPTPLRLSRFLAQHAGRRMDLDLDFRVGPGVVGVCVVVLPGREASMTRLCTNLPRTPFSLDLVGRLHRFRWPMPFGATPDSILSNPALKGLTLPSLGRPGNNSGSMVTRTLLVAGESNLGPTPSGQRGAMLRAFDKATGEEVGAVYMAAPQSGSPMT